MHLTYYNPTNIDIIVQRVTINVLFFIYSQQKHKHVYNILERKIFSNNFYMNSTFKIHSIVKKSYKHSCQNKIDFCQKDTYSSLFNDV